MNGLIAAILAGGRGERLDHLTAHCPKPLVPFGGTCRMIDFSIENCRNSGVQETVLMAKHMALPLVDYLKTQWGSSLLLNFGHWENQSDAILDEKGTADALINNRIFLDRDWTTDILVLHSDHIYNFDYRPMYARHLEKKAALTIGYQRIPRQFVSLFGMVDFNDQEQLTVFVEKPEMPTSDCVFTAVAVFNKAIMYHYLEQLAAGPWQHDISFDLIPAMLANGETIAGFNFPDYWEDIGTCERFFRTHMRLIDERGLLRAPVTLPGAADMKRISSGNKHDLIMRQSLLDAPFSGRRSFIFPGAEIGAGAHLENSVVLPGAKVEADERLDAMLVSATGRSKMDADHG
jgi:valienol-1-phosphate guanylyltransferase